MNAKNLAEAIPELRRPFTPAAVKSKIQSSFEDAVIVVYYLDARLVGERLNHVCADAWEFTIEPVHGGVMCHLSVFGKTRSDIGTSTGQDPEAKAKALISDAIKRAAVHFGIGVSVYAVPKLRLVVGDGSQALVKMNRRGKPFITTRGEDAARNHYAAWLEARGIQAFGQPLDHGDDDDAQGDADAEDAPETEAAPEPKTRTRRSDPAPATPAEPEHAADDAAKRFAKAHALAAKIPWIHDAPDDHAELRVLAQWMTSKDVLPAGTPAQSMRDLNSKQTARLEVMLDSMQKDPDTAEAVRVKVHEWVARLAAASLPGVES